MPIISNEIYFKKIIKDDKELGDVLLSILKENNSKAYGYELSIKGYMYLFLSILCKKYVEQGKLVIYEKSLKKINSILKFMENNFCDELRLDYICREFKMKKSNFCNMFKKKTGKTYIQYLNTLRVTEAATLLNQSNSSVTYISSSVGFDDVNYFSKVFKKHFNVSPQNYRNQMLNKDVNSK